MNSLNYIGSKHTLYPELKPHFDRLIGLVSKGGKQLVFGDLFAGTGIVGYNIGTSHNAKIIANDIQNYSFVINSANVSTYTHDDINSINKHVKIYNTLPGIQGFIYKNYSPHDHCERMYFTVENAMKIDAIRNKLRDDEHALPKNVYMYLLASLISAADKVANTSCVYGAYLKQFKKSAEKAVVLIGISKETKQVAVNGTVYCENISSVKLPYMDIVYLDPPYNNRQYAPNYHILETISLGDEPEIHGKTGLRDYSHQKSQFCVKSRVADEMKNVISSLNTRFVVISYNDEGLIAKDTFIKLLEAFGKVDIVEISYKKFKAQAAKDKGKEPKKNTTEYLFILCKPL